MSRVDELHDLIAFMKAHHITRLEVDGIKLERAITPPPTEPAEVGPPPEVLDLSNLPPAYRDASLFPDGDPFNQPAEDDERRGAPMR